RLVMPIGTTTISNVYVTLPAVLTSGAHGGSNVPVQTPTPFPANACPILHLELGPLDLNLLGLVVHLDRVVLDITAVPGSGNLLGNLLCAIAHLLDMTPTPGPSDQIIGLLNRVLDLFGG